MSLKDHPCNVMLDMDGVLADFVLAFSEISEELYGISIRGTRSWAFNDLITQEQYKAIWAIVETRVDFWESLKPMFTGEDLQMIKRAHGRSNIRLYIITSRTETAGKSVTEQTRAWIRKHLGLGIPIFAVGNGSKGLVCHNINITHAIDDGPHYVEELLETGVAAYLINRTYNQDSKLPRVDSLAEFFEKILQYYG